MVAAAWLGRGNLYVGQHRGQEGTWIGVTWRLIVEGLLHHRHAPKGLLLLLLQRPRHTHDGLLLLLLLLLRLLHLHGCGNLRGRGLLLWSTAPARRAQPVKQGHDLPAGRRWRWRPSRGGYTPGGIVRVSAAALLLRLAAHLFCALEPAAATSTCQMCALSQCAAAGPWPDHGFTALGAKKLLNSSVAMISMQLPTCSGRWQLCRWGTLGSPRRAG